MAASKTVIGNLGLTRIGVKPVLNFDEDSKAAKYLNRVYDDLRDQEFVYGMYGFTIERAILAPSTTVPLFEYSFYLTLPADLLQLVWVDPVIGTFKRESQGLAANSDTVNIKYVKQVVNTSKYPEAVTNVIASRIALEAVRFLRGNDRELSIDMERAYNLAKSKARFLSSIESSPEDLGSDDWTGARGGGGSVFNAQGRPS